MPSPHRFPTLLLAALLWVMGISGAAAQWLVYELRFTPEEESVNFSFYTGGYVVVPAEGGAATVLLTTEDGGRFYAVAESSGKFFMAANASVRKAVFAAAALTGTSQSFYTASGHMNRSLLLSGNGGTRSWRVAESLTGRLMTADDESFTGPSADGSLGVVGSALMLGTLREDLTANASAAFTTQNAATAYLIELLEKYGYVPDVGSLPAPLISSDEAAMIDASLFPVEIHGQGPAQD
ncbi:hypothetical protein EI77_01130 [Prosthecobacter fusiformis]|uniref:Uncharacterized protein n=1 Tax=Prosthecobacter fusiformis TaxID=48464 RepID=A0A4R7SRF2_9BACT|nr:hypothetical protein [Prosthecobacter fusiformis]TDU81820.1 hypothetical protein EI77_01130 [Prosthecobacter fusiformis]